ncbi:hypothetical protein [Pontiella sulfatireligans]|uniref:Type 4 fimbrial biogenesis protein PilX N-terminal domain-containing protein n=1 Tax=Pontiella sulfatireligans TaxID=2750658 RepID=A0A6C2UGA6_9BACT|nr:hypothetical protein [Pontiella sulfatireligans]VGO19158.1 hypothetical protein SCARR_01215 [Pontiella sulfatireligans]
MKTKAAHAHKEAFSLVVILLFLATMSTMLAMLAVSSSQRAFTARRLTSNIKAKAIAEAGCEYAYSMLAADWDGRYQMLTDDGSALASVQSAKSINAVEETASYQLKVKAVNSTAMLVSSTGTCGSVSAVSVVSVQNIGGSSEDGSVLDDEAFSYAILCGGDFDFSGCGTISSPGDQSLFHANGDMFLRGNTDALIDLSSSQSIVINNNVTVGGDVAAPDFGKTKWNKVSVSGVKTQGEVATVPIPDIDLTPYYNWALDHGEVHSGFTTTTDITPDGGILWVEGDVHISAHAVVSGSIIATGDINMSGQIDINPTTCEFGLVSRDGEIQVTSSGTINGLIYAKTGGLQHTANGEIVGQIIVNGDIKKAGNSDIMTGYAQSIPAPPGGITSTDNIVITAWQK